MTKGHTAKPIPTFTIHATKGDLCYSLEGPEAKVKAVMAKVAPRVLKLDSVVIQDGGCPEHC